MYDFIAIWSENVTRYIPANADAEIYDYLRSLGLGHDDASEVAGWALVASVGELFSLDGVICEIRTCGDSNI